MEKKTCPVCFGSGCVSAEFLAAREAQAAQDAAYKRMLILAFRFRVPTIDRYDSCVGEPGIDVDESQPCDPKLVEEFREQRRIYYAASRRLHAYWHGAELRAYYSQPKETDWCPPRRIP